VMRDELVRSGREKATRPGGRSILPGLPERVELDHSIGVARWTTATAIVDG